MTKLVKKDQHGSSNSILLAKIFKSIFKNAFLITGLFFLFCFWYTDNYQFLRISSILCLAIISIVFAMSIFSFYKFGFDNVYAEIELSFANLVLYSGFVTINFLILVIKI